MLKDECREFSGETTEDGLGCKDCERSGACNGHKGLTADIVGEDNPHGTNWKLLYHWGCVISSFPDFTVTARYESCEGFWADYLFNRTDGLWVLGAN